MTAEVMHGQLVKSTCVVTNHVDKLALDMSVEG